MESEEATCDWLDDGEDDTVGCFADDEEWLDAAEEQQDATSVELAPAVPMAGKSLVAKTYNRIGGALERVGAEYGVDVAAAIAVFVTESGPYVHVPGKAIIRFEVHLFQRLWMAAHPAGKDYFRFDPAKKWTNHRFRASRDGQFIDLHKGGQAAEYAALAKATELAGEDIALRCISIGGPQVLVKHYAMLGYSEAKYMWRDWQGSEEAQVRGFFKFCEASKLAPAIQAKDFDTLAKGYNGLGQWKKYGAKIRAAYETATLLLTTIPSAA